MEIKHGLYKKVFILNNIVIKIPTGFSGIMAMLSEQYGYLTVESNLRHLLLPIYFIPLIPIHIQNKVEICDNFDLKTIKHKFLHLSKNYDIRYEVFTDIKPNNFGWHNNKIVKIDYDFNYYFDNFMIDIKLKIKEILK